MDYKITGHTKVLGIIGTPVGHSASPQMHNFSSQLLGEDYVYVAFDVSEKQAGKALEAMRTLGIRGYNVTMPCKKAVIPYLDHISPEAKLMGAVNTIVNENGVLTGYNTDGIGMMESIRQAGGTIQESTITLFGTGGAATAILVQSVLEGCKEIFLYNRKGEASLELQNLIDTLEAQYPHCQITLASLQDEKSIAQRLSKSDIVINATPLGMAPETEKTPVGNSSFFSEGQIVVDAVYNPRNTRFLKDAKEAGAIPVEGLNMLLWQGVEAYRLFTGKEMPVDEVKKRVFRSPN